jgi:excisionase family DNA binding protein
MTETQEMLLTVSEAARFARVSKVHLWRLVRSGEVEAIRVGEGHGPLRIPRDPFLRWLYGTEEEEPA